MKMRGMTFECIYLDETDSTNRWLAENGVGEMVVVSDYQTAGRGQGGNAWESERGRNLLFSVLVHPVWLPADRQFLLSEAWALSLKDVLDGYAADIRVKWPNDIYWCDRKISGTLIETRLGGGLFKDAIIGTGINVNQQCFFSDAPNPVSLWQITGQETDRDTLLHQVLEVFGGYLRTLQAADYAMLRAAYHQALYRREGFYRYRDDRGLFDARLLEVTDGGMLVLLDADGRERRYGFKEVAFV